MQRHLKFMFIHRECNIDGCENEPVRFVCTYDNGGWLAVCKDHDPGTSWLFSQDCSSQTMDFPTQSFAAESYHIAEK